MFDSIRSKLFVYSRLIRFDKPIGFFLLLWPTLWALWMSSGGNPDTHILWVYVVGTFLMRSAGCALNDYADRNFDPHVKRTATRPLAAGEIAPWEAIVLAGILSFVAFGLVLSLNFLTIKLSFLALFFAFTYPYVKRFFHMPQAYLGIAFGFGIPMAWASTSNNVSVVALLLMLANFFWVIAYDTQYAMVDRDDDVNISIKTSAILFGKYDILFIIIFQIAFLFTLVLIGMIAGFGVPYFVGIFLAGLAIGSQYPMIKFRSRGGCLRAFRRNSLVGSIVFFGIFADAIFIIN